MAYPGKPRKYFGFYDSVLYVICVPRVNPAYPGMEWHERAEQLHRLAYWCESAHVTDLNVENLDSTQVEKKIKNWLAVNNPREYYCRWCCDTKPKSIQLFWN